MTAEIDDYLRTANRCLDDARTLQLRLPRIAARESHLAVYHAAQAYLFYCTGKIAKTHSGLRAEFARLAKDDPRIDRVLVQLLLIAGIADAPDLRPSDITLEDAEKGIQTAARFVSLITALVALPSA
jgi:uncharacterized protein (UPF0332 family)